MTQMRDTERLLREENADLRWAARRMLQALDAFNNCLPPDSYRWWGRYMKYRALVEKGLNQQ